MKKIILILLVIFVTTINAFTPAYPNEDKTLSIFSYKFGYQKWSPHSFSGVEDTYILLGPMGTYNISKTSTKLTFLFITLTITILLILYLRKRKKRKVEQKKST